MNNINPPFGGTDACPACPIEVRDIYATASNYLRSLDNDEPSRTAKKLLEFRESTNRLGGIVSKHFADQVHSQNTGYVKGPTS